MTEDNKLPETKTASKLTTLIGVLIALSPAIYGIYIIVNFDKGAPSATSIAAGMVTAILGKGCIGISVLILIIWRVSVVARRDKQNSKQNNDQPLD